MKVALKPFGQSGTKSAEWNKKIKELKAKPVEWPRRIMSYEVWCACTEYDGSEDGGERFQKLMHYLLVEGTGSIGNDFEKYTDKYFTSLKKIWPGWDESRWNRYWSTNIGKIAHTSKHSAKHEIRGADAGANSGENVGFTYPGTNKQKKLASTWQASVTRRPYSRVNWLQITDVQMGGTGTSQDGSVLFVSDGASVVGNCKEKEACMSSGNLCAAIFGLYFYPGCREKDCNWTVKQMVEGKEFNVRMRMWNPAYEFVSGNLLIQEPLNPDEAHQVPRNEKGAKMVGGQVPVGGKGQKRGFLFPQLYFEAGRPLEPEKLIRGPGDDKTRIAPFWDSEDGIKGDERVEKAGEILSKVFKCAYKPEKSTYFGFNVPVAHWLYPHYYAVDEIIGLTKDTSSILFQKWPNWNKNREDAHKQYVGVQKHYQLFKMDVSESN